MAKTMTPPTAPSIPNMPKVPTAEELMAGATEAKAKPAKPTKVKAPKLQELFDTADQAVAAAQNRTKGPRRAFEVKYDGSTYYVVHNNEGRAAGVVGLKLGMNVQEIGKVRKQRAVGIDGILEAVNALPESERAAVMAQLKSLVS